MIRLAIALTIFTLVLHDSLPTWRAKLSRPFHQQCLKYTPVSFETSVREIQQSLVCGRNLKTSENLKNWKDLGLIHILVVSGGHLTILAKAMMMILIFLLRPRNPASAASSYVLVAKSLVAFAITLLTFANQFEPPVLRAWLDHFLRPKLKTFGWQPAETSFITTWFALPAVADQGDLISLGLSFFASVVVETVSAQHHERPILMAVSMQSYLWWALVPFLIPLGLPHPLSTLANVLIAPVLGSVLIPVALFTYMINQAIPLNHLMLHELFPFVWNCTERLVQGLGAYLPDSAQPLGYHQRHGSWNISWFNYSYTGLITLCLGLLIRFPRQSQQDRRRKKLKLLWLGALSSLLIASVLHGTLRHQALLEKKRPPNSVAADRSSVEETKLKMEKKPKRGKVCIPYQANERLVHNKHCRRRRSSL